MVKRVNEISSGIRAALSISEPDLDTSVGSVARKIIDAVAEPIAEAYTDSALINYQYDIDAKTGADLDDFCRLFGITRFPAKRAVGTVVFERGSASGDVLVPVNAQLSTDGTFPIVVQTTVPALLLFSEQSVQVPVQAVVGGAAGNVSANSIRQRVSPLDGVRSFTNPNALAGGADPESDEQLRARFKATVFRSMAGTTPMFLGIALDDPAVTHANVIGATKTFRDTIDLVSGTGTSTVQDAKYIYPDSEVFGPNIDIGDVMTPNVHYTFDSNVNPPEVTGIGIDDGIYDITYEYLPIASRNDPSNGITNRIDVYVDGQRPAEASETTVFRTSRVFNSTPSDPLNVSNFERPDGSHPDAGNFFVAFAFAPVTDPSIDGVINIDGTDYTEGTSFWLVNDVTNQGGTPNSLSGIEIQSNANGGPADPSDGKVFENHYLFNTVPRDIELAVRQWRLITTDVRVHQAKPIRLLLNVAIILERGYPSEGVQSEIESELNRHIGGIGFHGVVQVSDLMEVIAGTPGVDAVRFLRSDDDAVDYAIQQVNSEGSVTQTFQSGGRAIDIFLADDEYPIFDSIRIELKSLATFGQV